MRVKILAFCGYARVGKNTVAEAPCFNTGTDCMHTKWTHQAFANPLKSDVMSMIVGASKRINLPKDTRPKWQWFHDAEKKEQIRPLLVEHGRFMRILDPDYWVKRMDSQHLAHDSDGEVTGSYIITDLRYKNEAEWVWKYGGTVVGILRPGYKPANGEEARSLQLFNADYTLTNDGTKKELWDKIAILAATLGLIKKDDIK